MARGQTREEAQRDVDDNFMESIPEGKRRRRDGDDAKGDDKEEVKDSKLMCEPVMENRVPKTMFDPLLPAAQEIAEHEVSGHRPYRRWCKICQAAWGKGGSPQA